MKPLLLALLTLLCAPLSAQTSDTSKSDGWKLVWADEFNTDGPPNPKNWTPEHGFVRNEEAQWYRGENAQMCGGLLVIEGRREKTRNPNYAPGSDNWKTNREYANYTAASISTGGKHQWQYGRFEMRARIDTGSGLWPAFWTVGVNGEWPSCGEVDIMEFYRGSLLANVAWGTAHRYKARWHSTSRPISRLADPAWAQKFHVWRMDWDKDAIRLLVDGQLLNETLLKDTVNQDGGGRNPFRQPHFLLLNLAIGGQNGGDPAHTTFPARFLIDYVRVYQKRPG